VEEAMRVGHTPSYVELLAQVEPHPIGTEEEAETVREEINRLLDRDDLVEDEWEFLALLGDLLSAWERRWHRPPAVPVPDKIRALLESHALRQKDLVGTVFATETVASDVMRGRRQLTYEHVDKLARFFHVSPAVFYPVPE
jgi:HTH-type transcriptional regulator/antitoxin HigA